MKSNIETTKKLKNQMKIIFYCLTNFLIYLLPIIQQSFELWNVDTCFTFIVIADFLECLCGIIYVIANQYENTSFIMKPEQMERIFPENS